LPNITIKVTRSLAPC